MLTIAGNNVQVYAPVDMDRTLYVFGCNSVDCTETPGSWRVLRDQNEAAMVAAATAAAGSDTKAPDQAALGSQKNAWDAAGSESDSSDWGDDDDDENDPFASASGAGGGDDDLIDLEKLMLQRDDAMTAATNTTSTIKNPKQQSKPTAATSSSTPATFTKKLHTVAFPALPIEVVDEPYEDYASENDFSHENALLEDYMKAEEEDKSTDVGDLRKIISSTKKNKGNGASGAGATTGSSSSESYEKTPAQQRHFMRFQKRISRSPLQCLRYDYGGEPLWPVPKPQSIQIPKCVCGEARVFELQLTPTINYFLRVDQFASSVTTSAAVPAVAPDTKAAPTPTGKAAPPALKSAGGGMDWLSVMVYCCPKSCSRSREEVVVVLPAEKAKLH